MTELNHACNVCGKNESTVTVLRKWLHTVVYSDECSECYEYLNSKTNSLVADKVYNKVVPIDGPKAHVRRVL